MKRSLSVSRYTNNSTLVRHMPSIIAGNWDDWTDSKSDVKNNKTNFLTPFHDVWICGHYLYVCHKNYARTVHKTLKKK